MTYITFFLDLQIKLSLMAEPIIGIYKITSPSGKIYIGKSKDIESRKFDYSLLKCSSQPRVYNSIKAHGWSKHTFEIIEECTIEILSTRERFWQDYYDVIGKNGLNCILTLTTDKSGKVHPDTIERMREAKAGIKSKQNRAVANAITGEEYYSAKYCAEMNDINANTLVCKLIGKNVNDTPFIYLDELHLKDMKCNQKRQDQKGKSNNMYGRTGELAPSSRKVECTKTGRVWNTILECANENGIHRCTLGGWLRGTSPNKSTFKFVEI